MATSFKLSMQLGASLGSSVRATFKGAESQLNQLGSTVNRLKNQQKSIRRFEMDTANVEKSRLAYRKAQRELSRLKKEFRETMTPTLKMQSAFEQAQKKVDRLSASLETQRSRLQRSGAALSKAGVSTENLAHENQRLGRSVDRLNTKYRRLGKSIQQQKQLSAKRSELRGQLFDAVALGAAVVAPIAVAVNFEASVAKLGAITRSSDEELKSLSKTARDLGENTQFSASQATDAMTFLGMAGFSTNEILAATPGVLNLAQAAGQELGATADIASNILSGFALEAKETGRVGDVLTLAFTSSNTTLSSLGETMKFVAPVAAAAGASIELVAAMTGLLGDAGIQGGRAGTALRATFLRLSAPTGQASDALSGLGVDVQDAMGNLRPMPQLLKEIAAATEDMGSAQRTEVIKQIFGEEAASGVTQLLSKAASGELDTFITELENAQGSADRVAKKMAATTRGSLKRLGSALESVAISVGSLLLPVIASGAEMFASFASGISTLAQEFPLLTQVIVGATVGLIALRIITIGTTFAYTFMKGAVLSLRTAYFAVSAGMTLAKGHLVGLNILSLASAARTGIVTAAQWAWNVALTANPLGLVVAGIGALIGAGVLLVKNWDKVKTFFAAIWSGLKKMTGSAVSWLLDNINLLLNPFALVSKIVTTIGSALFGSDGVDDVQNTSSSTAGNKAVATAALGSALSATAALSAPLPTTALPDIAPASAIQNTQHIRLDAPITINASPGMDAQAVADEVHRKFTEEQARMAQAQRASLFDLP
ncbi:MAG: phage tail tape measure protein [Agarilytica sp.]